jgi:HD-GYP domain-containing protein (c-di-GMP phosphodiesterase class II)
MTTESKERFQCFYIPLIACLSWGCILGAAMILGAASLALGMAGLVAIIAVGTAFLLAARREQDFRLLNRAKARHMSQENQDLRGSLQVAGVTLAVSRYAVFPSKLFSSLEKKFPEMSGHWEWVSCYCALLARRLGLEAEQIELICRAARLMDLGMLELDEGIRLRRGEPIEPEKAMIRNHPICSEKMLARLDDSWAILPLVRSHHEWWNGLGYPDGLQGEEIPLGARIIALADAFVAMLSPRSYREARDLEDVLDEVLLYKGEQFDPRVVEAFLELMIERFDLPESEWARLQADKHSGEAGTHAASKWGSPESEGELLAREEHEFLETLWDINGVKRLNQVA